EDRVGRRVDGRRHPGGPAAPLPGVLVLREVGLLLVEIPIELLALPGGRAPRALPTGVGDGPEPPRLLAVSRVVRVDEAAHAVLGARIADDDQPLVGERGDRQAVTGGGI